MSKHNSKIPSAKVDQVLFKNRHTCCICHELHKPVQIHHIDGDPSNHSLDNLCVLCLDHHGKVSSNEGLGRKFTTREVKFYKDEWEGFCGTLAKQATESRILSKGQTVYIPAIYNCKYDKRITIRTVPDNTTRLIMRNVNPDESIRLVSIKFGDPKGALVKDILFSPKKVGPFESYTFHANKKNLNIFPYDLDGGRPFFIVEWEADNKVIPPRIAGTLINKHGGYKDVGATVIKDKWL